jgi:hypothetical protein
MQWGIGSEKWITRLEKNWFEKSEQKKVIQALWNVVLYDWWDICMNEESVVLSDWWIEWFKWWEVLYWLIDEMFIWMKKMSYLNDWCNGWFKCWGNDGMSGCLSDCVNDRVLACCYNIRKLKTALDEICRVMAVTFGVKWYTRQTLGYKKLMMYVHTSMNVSEPTDQKTFLVEKLKKPGTKQAYDNWAKTRRYVPGEFATTS